MSGPKDILFDLALLGSREFLWVATGRLSSPGRFLALEADFLAVQIVFWPSRATVWPSRLIFWLKDWFSGTPDRFSGAQEARKPSFSLELSTKFAMFAQTVINILGSRLTWPKSRQECPTSRPRAATSAPRVAQEPPETRPDPAKSLVARPGVAQEQPTEPQDLAPGRPESPRSRPTAANDGPTGLGPSLPRPESHRRPGRRARKAC